MDAEFTLGKQKKENQKQKKLQPIGSLQIEKKPL